MLFAFCIKNNSSQSEIISAISPRLLHYSASTRRHESYVGRVWASLHLCPIVSINARLHRVMLRMRVSKQRKILVTTKFIIDVMFITSATVEELNQELGHTDSYAFAFLHKTANWRQAIAVATSFKSLRIRSIVSIVLSRE